MAREGIYGTHKFDEEDNQPKDNANVPQGYSKITAEGRRHREDALH